MNRAAWPRGSKALSVGVAPAVSREIMETNIAAPSVLTQWPGLRVVAKRIGVPELQRRLTHMSPGLLPFLLWVIPHQDPWGPLLMNSMLVIAASIIGVALYRFHVMARWEAETGFSAVIGYALPVLTALIWLPGRAEIGMMTLAILAVGDGSATLGGLWFGGRRLPWNSRKTFSGLLCFCLCGTILGTVVYWGESRPQVAWTAAFVCASLATVTAAFVESLPLTTNDNLRVGATAAIVAAAVQTYLLGC